MEYAAVFTVTSEEGKLAKLINTYASAFTLHDIFATPAIKTQWFSRRGVFTPEEKIFLPGYIFIGIPEGVGPLFRVEEIMPSDTTMGYRVLKQDGGGINDWRLYGPDRRFAESIISNHGKLPPLKVVTEGSWVKINDGPLKNLSGQIIKVDKLKRSCKVQVTFNGKIFTSWLAYDLVS